MGAYWQRRDSPGGWKPALYGRQGCPPLQSLVFPRVIHGDAGARCGGTFEEEFAADFFHALAHVAQAVGMGVVARLAEAVSVVFDADAEKIFVGSDAELDFGGIGMAHDIIERFLDGEK